MIAPVIGRKLCRASNVAWVATAATRSSSSSAARSAAVLPSTSRAAVTPQPPPPAPEASTSSSAASSSAPLRPQPFIPKPLSRAYQIASIQPTPDSPYSTTITLTQANSTRSIDVPNLFLRDASIHPNHVHPASQQKLFRTSDIPIEGELKGYGVHEIAGEECLVTEWTTNINGVDTKSANLSVVKIKLLVGLLEAKEFNKVPNFLPWTQKQLANKLKSSSVAYPAYKEDDLVLYKTLTALLEDGIVFLSQVDFNEKIGRATELKRVVERIGSIRHTWYGDLFDVKAEEGSKNIAYTNLDLGLHMDLTHFESPPRYQFLQSLQNGAILGGSSYFVDAFAVAEKIRQTNPRAFKILCHEPILFEYKNGGHHTKFTRPTIELEPGSTRIHAVNYSPPFQGPLPTLSDPSSAAHEATRLEDLHHALSLFAAGCDDAEMRYETQLQPGDCVIFDNRRVLHARTAFEFSQEETADGKERGRWLKGAYMDGDEVRSKWRVLDEKLRT